MDHQIKVDSKSFEDYDKLGHRFLVRDLILALLSISPINLSKIQVFVFLAWKEAFYGISLDPVFSASKSGPYSLVVKHILYTLCRSSYISKKGHVYYLTANGRQGLLDRLERFREFTGIEVNARQVLNNKVELWTSMSTTELISYLYSNYSLYFLPKDTEGIRRNALCSTPQEISIFNDLKLQIKRHKDTAREESDVHVESSVLSDLNKFNEDLICYDRALDIDPNNAAALYNKGSTLSKLGKYEEDISYFDRTLKIDPNNAAAYASIGNAHSKLGNYNAAIDLIRKATDIYEGTKTKSDNADANSGKANAGSFPRRSTKINIDDIDGNYGKPTASSTRRRKKR